MRCHLNTKLKFIRAFNLKLLSSNSSGCRVVVVSGMFDPEGDAEDIKGTGEWTGINMSLLYYVNFPLENPKGWVR